MKIRNGFVSNSSSSSFIICDRGYINNSNREEIRNFIENHECCYGYYNHLNDYDGVFFEISGFLREKILEHFDDINDMFEISKDLHYLDDSSEITEDMVGCTVSSWSGWDGEGCPNLIEKGDLSWEGEELIEALFSELKEEEYSNIKKVVGIEG